MPHIHTEPGQVDHTATGFVVVLSPDNPPRILLHLHKKLNMLLPFGGHIELHETPWQAIAHELQEESGYTLEELMIMQPSPSIKQAGLSVVHPQPVLMNTHTFKQGAKHYHSDTAYLFTAQGMPLAQPSEGESIDLRLMNRDEIATLSAEHIYDDTRSTTLALFDTFLNSWTPVPATEFSLDLPQA